MKGGSVFLFVFIVRDPKLIPELEQSSLLSRVCGLIRCVIKGLSGSFEGENVINVVF